MRIMDENSYFQIVQWICIMVLGAFRLRHMLMLSVQVSRIYCMFLHSNFLLEKTQHVFGTPSNVGTLIIEQTCVEAAKVFFSIN
jgi:hypothetical protein